MLNLSNLLFNKSYVPPQYSSGGETMYTELILAKFKRQKAVYQNKIFDYIYVESDPNFSPRSQLNSKKLDTLLGKLSLSTSLVTMVKSKLQLMKLYEFVPVNLRYLMDNFQAVIDTNSNALQNVTQLISFQTIEQAFLSDLKLQFSFGTISYAQIAEFTNRFLTAFPIEESIDNVSIRSLLSLGVQNILPTDYVQFFDGLQWIDIIDSVLGEGFENEKEAIDGIFASSLTSNKTQLVDYLSEDTITSISTHKLTLDDLFGTAIQAEAKQQITDGLVEDFTSSVLSSDDIPNTVTQEQLQTLIDQFVESYLLPELDNTFFDKQVGGLPPITEVSEAISIESYNKTVSAIDSAINRFASDLMLDLGVVYDSTETQKPIDFLFNVRRNLKLRLDYKQNGNYSETFTQLDNYLRKVFGKSDSFLLSDSELEQLNETFRKTFKETN